MCEGKLADPSRSEIQKYLDLPFSFEGTPELRSYIVKNKGKSKSRESVMCQNCGSFLIIGGSRLVMFRKTGIAYCDRNCAGQDRSRLYRNDKTWNEKKSETTGQWAKSEVTWSSCKCCGKMFVKRGWRKTCSDACRDTYEQGKYKEYLAKLRQDRASHLDSGEVTCQYCGKKKHFYKRASKRKFCSDHCLKKATKQRRDHWERTNGPSEYISVEELMNRHKDKCCNCGCKVVPQDGEYKPNAATIDHIVPLSKGGWHAWSNVQLMCHLCNSLKSNDIKDGEQLMLVIASN